MRTKKRCLTCLFVGFIIAVGLTACGKTEVYHDTNALPEKARTILAQNFTSAVNDTEHSATKHTVDCYVYVWYNSQNEVVSGIAKVFVNSKLNNVGDTLSENVQKLTLRDIGINIERNNILNALADVPLSEISTQINELKLGTVLGYEKKECKDLPEGYTNPVYGANGNYAYVLDTVTGKYYYAKLNCKNVAHVEIGNHDRSCYEYVWYEDKDYTTEASGINGKMSNMSIEGLGSGNGLTEIVVDLTIGDLIDSGMMTIEDEQKEYKLDIIFDESGKCSFVGYTSYIAANQSLGQSKTPKDYYISEHDSDETYRGAWKEMKLADFIDSLLGAI